MANYPVTFSLTIVDTNGNEAEMRWNAGPVADSVTLATLAGQITAALTALGAPGTITNGKVISAVGTFLYEKATPTTGAVDAEYSSVKDKAILNFINSGAGRGILSIPAPIATVFGSSPNENTVDPAGAAAPLITWFTGHATTRDGGLLNIYNGGVKQGRHAPKRAQHRVV